MSALLLAAVALLPVNPFTAARAGDWWVLETRDESGTHRMRWQIEKISGDTVHLELHDLARKGLRLTATASKSAPALSLYDLDSPLPLPITDEVCELKDRKVPCKRLAYRAGGYEVTARFSAAVRGGLVSVKSSVGSLEGTSRLVGFGRAGTVEYDDPPGP